MLSVRSSDGSACGAARLRARGRRGPGGRSDPGAWRGDSVGLTGRSQRLLHRSICAGSGLHMLQGEVKPETRRDAGNPGEARKPARETRRQRRRASDRDRLESALQRSILLDVHPVLHHRRGANATDLARCGTARVGVGRRGTARDGAGPCGTVRVGAGWRGTARSTVCKEQNGLYRFKRDSGESYLLHNL